MAFHIPLAQLVQLLAATPLNLQHHSADSVVIGVSTDSRSVQPGEVFVALRGERFDGHEFVATAIERGAIAAITDHPMPEANASRADADKPPLLVVADTLKAYQAIAHWWREQFQIPIIAVTGSVGKTTTKELIAAVLATQGEVLKTQANYNNEIGVPKTLLELKPGHKYAVIEMGMRGAGEIALLTQIARPDIAVITNVGTAHIGRLGSEQAIAEAKCELLRELPTQGVAVLNHDNLRLLQTAAKVWQGKQLTYGLEGGDLRGNLVDPVTLEVEGIRFPLPLPGRHNALNYLAALAVARILQVDLANLKQGIAVQLPKGRAKRYELPENIIVLDETYNAGLESTLAALHLLAETPGKRHIAVLGTMKELGDRSPDFHYQVGAAVRQLQLDGLLILADEAESQAMAEGAAPLSAERCSSYDEVVQRLQKLAQPGDRILFKASRAVELDQAVEKFCQIKGGRLV